MQTYITEKKSKKVQGESPRTMNLKTNTSITIAKTQETIA